MSTITVLQLFAAVCMLENPTGIKGVHPDGVSYGVAGITQSALNDVNANRKVKFTLADMDEPALAMIVFDEYTKLRCAAKKLSFSPENRLRVWHPGSEEYVERVINLCERQEGERL